MVTQFLGAECGVSGIICRPGVVGAVLTWMVSLSVLGAALVRRHAAHIR